MVAKPVTIGVVGVIVLASALVLNHFVLPGEEGESATAVVAPVPPSAKVPPSTKVPPSAGAPASANVAPAGAATASAEQSSKAGAPGKAEASGDEAPKQATPAEPSFDVVRVDPEGNTVLAGRGAPNAEIAIMDGDGEIGRVTTDARGEWVFIPPSKLSPGQRVLHLRQSDAPPSGGGPSGGGPSKSGSSAAGAEAPTGAVSDSVILVIPEKGRDIAGRPSSEPSVPLVMVVPKDEPGAGGKALARVLQAPAAGPLTEGTKAAVPPAAAQVAAVDDKGSAATPPASGTVAAAPPSAPAPSPAPSSGMSSGTAAAGASVSAYPETAASGAAAAAVDAVAVDVIDYDDKGEVVFSGRADPGARVEVFIDDEKVGDTGADAEGRWTMRPEAPVAPGSYQLRVDKVAAGGTVEARVAFPFVRADPLTELPGNRLVVIQPGNNLWRIATRVYGSGVRYVEIFDANKDQILNPDLIYPGQVFGLPRTN